MYQKPVSITLAEATRKLEYYCAYQDRCHKEVEAKLNTYNLIPEAKDKILLHLMEHNFLNEERFAKSFARGKFKTKHWGKNRIVRELKFRNISSFLIKIALQEIPEEDYLQSLHTLASKKLAQITESNIFKKKKKLADYLLYRGWETQLVYDKINELTS
ncbi:regulatory protein RecX [Aquimarina brevivitae]|uniref:Regulatory protein RecX n=1 Tax=Aquimarina brevivitae TaxID=323412 RepID=A0A4Q7PHE9_9FLAO|nr:regulatory protein RecX [Aquimarina brevivitae]RZS99577.1 regulatory protein [Aquimarina brevivitae]